MAKQPTIQVTVPRKPVAGWLADLSVATKSLAAATIAGLVALGVGGLSVARMGTLNGDVLSMKAEHVDSLEQLSVIGRGTGAGFEALFRTMYGAARKDLDTVQQARVMAADADTQVDEAVAAYGKIAAGSPERQAALGAFTEAQEQFRILRNTVVFGEAPPSGVTLPAQAQLKDAYTKASADMTAALAALQQLEHTSAEQKVAQATDSYHAARTLTIAVLAIGVLLSMAIGIWVVTMMRRSVAGGRQRAGRAGRRRPHRHRRGVLPRRARSDGPGRQPGQRRHPADRRGAGHRRPHAGQELAAVDRGDRADRRQRPGGLGPGQPGGVRRRGGLRQRADASPPARSEMGASIREIAQNANDAAQVAAQAVERGRVHQPHGVEARRLVGRDRQRGQGDHLDRRADQPARPQRDHRGRPRRRGRQGLRGRRQRGQGPGAGDRPGHRGHLPPGRGDPGRHQQRGRRDRRDQRDHRPDQRLPAHHRLGGRGADRDHQRDEPQRRRRRQRHHRHRRQHRRRRVGDPDDHGHAGRGRPARSTSWPRWPTNCRQRCTASASDGPQRRGRSHPLSGVRSSPTGF